MEQKLGVFLSRMQPLHIGHLGIIETALKENDKIIIIIGSKNKKETLRNPLDVILRKEILEETLDEKYSKKDLERIKIIELPDWSMETDVSSNAEWGRYLYYNIVSSGEQKHFTMYFSDNPKIIEDWFDEELKKRIDFRFFERNELFNAVSSTKIREAFLNDDKEYIKKNCPKAVLARFEGIQDIIKRVSLNPKGDYIMY